MRGALIQILITNSFNRYILDMPIVYASLESGDDDWKARWTDMHSVLVLALQRVWTCVRNILCNDAPEGHVPDETSEDENMTTKDILSYSWRALKEARYGVCVCNLASVY